MLSNARRTKIVCTLGPSSNTLEGIENLYKAGMNVVRINFSHGSHEVHARTIGYVRKVPQKHQYSIPVLMDLQGPTIRRGTMKDGTQELVAGELVLLTPVDVEGTSEVIPLDTAKAVEDARTGRQIWN